MARTVEDIVKVQVGELTVQVAALIAQNEALIERVTELEAEEEEVEE